MESERSEYYYCLKRKRRERNIKKIKNVSAAYNTRGTAKPQSSNANEDT
jgi:hypothetical protein